MLLLFCPILFPAVSSPSVTGTSLLLSAQGKPLSQFPASSPHHPSSPVSQAPPSAHMSSLHLGFMSDLSASSDFHPIISRILPNASASVLPLLKCFLPVASRGIHRGTVRRFFLWKLQLACSSYWSVCSEMIYTLNFFKITSCAGPCLPCLFTQPSWLLFHSLTAAPPS